MYLPVIFLICLSVTHLSSGQEPVEEIIVEKKVHLLGGWAPVNPEARDVKEAANYAVTDFNTNSKSKKMFKLVSITAAKNKVTNVLHYKFSVFLGKTECLKSENHDLENCSVEQRQLKCKFEVTFDPRNDKHEMLSQSCKRVQKI